MGILGQAGGVCLGCYGWCSFTPIKNDLSNRGCHRKFDMVWSSWTLTWVLDLTRVCIVWALDITSFLNLEVSLVAMYYVLFFRLCSEYCGLFCSCRGLTSPICLCSTSPWRTDIVTYMFLDFTLALLKKFFWTFALFWFEYIITIICFTYPVMD